jgi:hypothetical protein
MRSRILLASGVYREPQLDAEGPGQLGDDALVLGNGHAVPRAMMTGLGQQ